MWRGVEKTRTVPVQRFRCTSCDKTFSLLPWFLLWFIRSAAVVVQKCWEEWNRGTSTERVADQQKVSVRTLHRWRQVIWQRRRDVEQTVRRHVSVRLPEPPVENANNHRPWSQHVLTLMTRYLQHVPIPAADRTRPLYYFVCTLK